MFFRKNLTKVVAAMTSACLMAAGFNVSLTAEAQSSGSDIPDFSYIGKVGALSAEEAQSIAVATYKSLAERSTTVDVSSYDVDLTGKNVNDACRVLRHVATNYDIGLLSYYSSLSYSTMSDEIILDYRFKGQDYDMKLKEINGKIDSILSGVDESWTDYEKALYVHDYMSVNFDYQYDDSDADRHTAYGLLNNGKAVCQGYAELYSMLMHRLGIMSDVVSSDDINHAWNLLKIDGDWYFTDVTWDDCYQFYAGICNHNNFLKTTSEIYAAEHSSTDWQTYIIDDAYSIKTGSKFSSAYWNDSGNSLAYWHDSWVSTEFNSTSRGADFYIGSPESLEKEKLFSLGKDLGCWSVWNKPGYTWNATYCIPVAANGFLYYSTPEAIYCYQNGQNVLVYELNASEKKNGYIYGLYSDGKYLYYGIDKNIQNYYTESEKNITYNSVKLAELEKKAVQEAGEDEYVSQRTGTSTSTTTTSTTTTTTTSTTTSTTTTTTTTTSTTTTTTTSTTTTTTTTTDVSEYLVGDADGSGKITAADATQILRVYTLLSSGEEDTLSEDDWLIYDVDRSGRIEATDASLVLRYYTVLNDGYKGDMITFLREEAGVEI